MSINLDNLWLFRIIPLANLQNNISNGFYAKAAKKIDPNYISIGSLDVITRRDRKTVKCYPELMVNDFVPFYFSARTPMLYNIITGHGVPSYPQKDIIYLCSKFRDLACNDFKWCYTNGNAAIEITKFYSNFTNIETDIDWISIHTHDFRDANADGDEDRIRKKHAEFLVHNHVPPKYIKKIIVLDETAKQNVDKILKNLNIKIDILVNPNNKFYF